ncbi:MAG: NADH dehydrogenase [ubiquinone] 1 alpha subcomplex assembly factor 1 [Bacteroidia bacterium]|jgi:NADH dehydrogenase [ubiquinone] 1 alpha subcomplex assembly factor 1
MLFSFQLFIFLLFTPNQTMIIYDFNKECNPNDWKIVDDVVMGGRSDGNFKVDEDGNGAFFGHVSIRNNGGFSSVRYNFETVSGDAFRKFKIHLKGDGKKYQFRVKSNQNDRHSYVFQFPTSGEWEVIEIPFSEMTPAFRGRTLAISNFSGNRMEELAFLIGNKKEEDFRLEIGSVKLSK